MRDHRPTPTSQLMDDSKLSQLQQHAKQILAINHALSILLPRGTENYCRAANLRQGMLIIEVASAPIKMKLNYERLNLLNQLRSAGFAGLVGIELKINPELSRSPLPGREDDNAAKPREPLSDTAANFLRELAVNASPKLQKRLEKLAQLAKKRSD
ncbi:DUF721 domain-containing protein [Vibrio sp.]|uniref:DUF721 domain-containing protein n=1 Tax=Vibrio sp. TaxID=678 RepID=UPI003D0A45E8